MQGGMGTTAYTHRKQRERGDRMSAFPMRGEPDATPAEPRILSLEGEAADEVFETLGASTTRTVLSIIYERPATSTEIRDEIDTSLQNAHYHLRKLEDVGLIESAGVGYSEKGMEMTIYAPTTKAIVLFCGTEDVALAVDETE